MQSSYGFVPSSAQSGHSSATSQARSPSALLQTGMLASSGPITTIVAPPAPPINILSKESVNPSRAGSNDNVAKLPSPAGRLIPEILAPKATPFA